jgi:D-alanyl-lipoteichoic acid acyltransferase DltB (MBOAT superfamily)
VLFNSFEFLIFLPIVFALYWFVFNKSLQWQNLLVLVASYFFYGWWSWGFMGLLMLSTLLDYTYGFWVAAPNRKKAKLFLWLGIINNLGILGVFKYYNFFATQFQHGFELIGWHVNPVLLNIALPVGISFYTFHGMSYVFDIYRGQQKPVKNFVEYAVFVSFFPLLVAGPIERASHLLPQVQKRRFFDFTTAVAGFELIVWGFFKKVVVADNLAPAVNDIFGQYSNSDSLTLIGGAIYFSFQIYGDFSGYSDIARGVAKLFGFELLLNFNNPYSSRSIPEFWKKWHISLSSWFRDYLYIPLGGSRSGLIKTIRNVLIIFIVSGFWHGANWTYLFWGLIHGLCFVPSLLRKNKEENHIAHSNWWSRFIYLKDIALTFSITTIAWIFFRSETVYQGFNYIRGMFNQLPSLGKFISWRSESTEGSHIEFLFILLLFASADLIRRSKRSVVKTAVLIVLTIFFGSFINPSDFIYFQF